MKICAIQVIPRVWCEWLSGECVVYSERAALAAGLALTGDCQSK